MSNDIIVLHIGAGKHSPSKRKDYKKLIRHALSRHNILEASNLLEGSKLTNTGYGSSLNILGNVECDASSIVHGSTTRQRSMIGIDDSKYPIGRMNEIYDKLDEFYIENKFGLTTPVALNYQSVGETELWSERRELKESKKQLILKESQRLYDTYKPNLSVQEITDTIGLLCINSDTTTLASSSGGNAFKAPGRIGCAGIIGAAIDFKLHDNLEVSCMCSGNGEDITVMKLAHYVVNNIQLDSDYGIELKNLLHNYSSQFNLSAVSYDNEPIIYVGVIVVIRNLNNGSVTLVYCHTTETFYFGYKVNDQEENIVLSELENHSRAGKVFAYGEFKLM